MKHVLVVRGASGSPAFTRADRFKKQWIKHDLDGQPLRAIIPSIKADLEEMNGLVGVTMSSCRDGAAFVDPEAICIPSGVNVVVMAPMEVREGNAEMDGLRLWTGIHWSGPDRPPVLGMKVRQRVLGEWLESFFTEEQIDSWSRPRGALRLEVWLRPEWNAVKMFPGLFPKEKKEQDVDTGISAKVDAEHKKKTPKKKAAKAV